MPSRGLRTLPLRTEPLPGESLRSVLETAGRWYGLSTSAFAACLGLSRRIDRLSVAATPQQVTDMAFLLGLRPQQVQDTIWAMPVVPALAGTYCPRCLADNGGHWLLEWRLPYSALCRTHEMRLLTACPGCRRRPRGSQADRVLTQPAYCPCGRSLTTAPTDSVQRGSATDAGHVYGRTLLAQSAAGTPARVAGETVSAQEALADLRWLATRAHDQLHPHDRTAKAFDWTPDISCGSTPPSRPARDLPGFQHAVGLAAAVLGADSIDAAADALRWLVIRDRQQPHGPRTDWEHRQEWAGVGPGLRSALDTVLAGDPFPWDAPMCRSALTDWRG